MEATNEEGPSRNSQNEEATNSIDNDAEDTHILNQATLPKIPSSRDDLLLAAFKSIDIVSERQLAPEDGVIFCGEEYGKREAVRVRTLLEQALPGETVLVNFSNVSATTDFIEPIVQHLFYTIEGSRPVSDRRLIFLNPNTTTLFALARSAEAGNTNCLSLQSRNFPWTLQLVGHLERHLEKILTYIRDQPGNTTKDMVDKGLSRSLGNIGGRIRELMEMGLISRIGTGTIPAVRSRAEPQYRYYPFHPLMTPFPLFPPQLLSYEHFSSPHYSPSDFPDQEGGAPERR